MYIFDHISLISCYNEKRFNVVEKIKTHFWFNNFIFWKSCPLWGNVAKCTAGQATDESMVHVHCMLD